MLQTLNLHNSDTVISPKTPQIIPQKRFRLPLFENILLNTKKLSAKQATVNENIEAVPTFLMSKEEYIKSRRV